MTSSFSSNFYYVENNMKILEEKAAVEGSENIEEFDETNIYLMSSMDELISTLTIFDTNTWREDKKEIKINNLGKESCVVKLPNFKIFCASSGSNYKYGLACVIDTKNWTYTLLPSKEWYRETVGAYYKNQIYVFGGIKDEGSSHSCVPLAYKFDLLQKQWRAVSSLPIGSDKCSCITFNKKILIVGNQHRHIYSYDVDSDSYSIITNSDMNIGINNFKLLVSAKKRVYLMQEWGMMYESEILNEHSWENILECWDFYNWWNMYYVVNENMIYIGSNQIFLNNYFQFNLDTKKLKKIELANA
ncbi:unnamed protein product [Blepharisma stoltei]|uniref:Uncharacterized protein n=1 Tax=Blepharisma stoltei TaxID=1481888 RepID=A0AAU9I9M1_9CILI|nr:unnamed protein product [Blepharisma stoltei]